MAAAKSVETIRQRIDSAYQRYCAPPAQLGAPLPEERLIIARILLQARAPLGGEELDHALPQCTCGPGSALPQQRLHDLRQLAQDAKEQLEREKRKPPGYRTPERTGPEEDEPPPEEEPPTAAAAAVVGEEAAGADAAAAGAAQGEGAEGAGAQAGVAGEEDEGVRPSSQEPGEAEAEDEVSAPFAVRGVRWTLSARCSGNR